MMVNSQSRVLVAEDDPTSSFYLMEMIKRVGLQAEIAANGQEVLDKLKDNDYQLILMDISMPVLNGFEATEIIRKGEKDSDKHIPIVAVTAHTFKEIEDASYKAGMDDFISKPVNKLKLMKVLTDYIP